MQRGWRARRTAPSILQIVIYISPSDAARVLPLSASSIPPTSRPMASPLSFPSANGAALLQFRPPHPPPPLLHFFIRRFAARTQRARGALEASPPPDRPLADDALSLARLLQIIFVRHSEGAKPIQSNRRSNLIQWGSIVICEVSRLPVTWRLGT